MVAELKKRNSGAQRRERVLRLVDERAELFSRQGYVVQTWRNFAGKLGPYYRLRYREHGRQRSMYLGRDAELAEAAMHRQLKAVSDRELCRVGLRYHGNETCPGARLAS